MADQLQDFVQHMLDAGAPQETIDEGIKLFQSQHAVKPIAAAEPDTYIGGFVKGAKEGVVGGAKGFVKGLVPGVVNGVTELVKSPYTIGKGVVDAGIGAYHLYQDPTKVAHESVDAMAAMPGKVRDAVSAEATKAATDPEAFGNDVGNVTGTVMGGVAAGRAVPLLPGPIARKTGAVVESFGKKAQWPLQISGAHQILQGNPAGVIPMVMPQVLEKSGQLMRRLGGESAGSIRLGPAGIAKLNDEFDEAMVKRGMSFYDEQQAAKEAAAKETANADRLAAIEEAKGTRKATGPVIRESTSAVQPDGSKASMSTTFKKPEAAVDPNGPPPGWPPGVPYDPSKLGPIQPLRGGPKVTTLGAGDARPPIRIMGKAATDLADGTVPVASKAPMPSDVRMDEMKAKFAEGPKPARVSPQDSIPASKSKGAMSATPGLTRADVESIGLNPDMPIKGLTPEAVAQIKTNRASRHQTNYANAVSDKGVRAAKSDMTSILEQSLLARKYGLDQ